MNLTVVAGAGDGDVTAGIVNVEGSSGGEGLGQVLVALMFVAHEFVPVVLVDVETVEELGATAISNAAEDYAGDSEEKKKSEDSASDAATVSGLGRVGLSVLIVGPLEEQNDTGAYQQEGPVAPSTSPRSRDGGGRSGKAERRCRC